MTMDEQLTFKRMVGKTFDGFTLVTYSLDPINPDKHSFILECPMEHQHTYDRTSLSPETCEKHCWCQKQKPLKRERLRNELTREQAAQKFNITQHHITEMERKVYRTIEDLNMVFDLYQTPEPIRNKLIKEMQRTGQYKPKRR